MSNKSTLSIIYTLNTSPHINGRWGLTDCVDILTKTIQLYTLSIGWMNQWYSNITVHTDELGYELLKGLPVEFTINQYEDLDELWCLSKIQSIRNIQEPFCHVDGDFIMRKPLDLSTQTIKFDRIEKENFIHHYIPWLALLHKVRREDSICWWEGVNQWAPNCGIISVMDLSIRDLFVYEIDRTVSIFKQAKILPDFKYLIGKQDVNCVIEQFSIRRALEMCQQQFDFLNPFDYEVDQLLYENNVGYEHQYGMNKYAEQNSDKVVKELLQFFPDIYGLIQKNIKSWQQ